MLRKQSQHFENRESFIDNLKPIFLLRISCLGSSMSTGMYERARWRTSTGSSRLLVLGSTNHTIFAGTSKFDETDETTRNREQQQFHTISAMETLICYHYRCIDDSTHFYSPFSLALQWWSFLIASSLKEQYWYARSDLDHKEKGVRFIYNPFIFSTPPHGLLLHDACLLCAFCLHLSTYFSRGFGEKKRCLRHK